MNGFYFVEGMPKYKGDGIRIEPGLIEPENWEPYKLWQGDIWECQGCSSQIIVGTGMNPVTEHYKADFKEDVKNLSQWDPPYQVNDC